MANPGYNEGFHVLDDFVCEAIHAPSVPLADPANQGRNEGMAVVEEVVFDPNGNHQGNKGKERLPRLLICAICRARARELAKNLPVKLDELDFGTEGSDALVRVLSRYFLARELDFLRPREARANFLIDLAILMTDLARPASVFVGGAKQTAIDVADLLLGHEGWAPIRPLFPEWKERATAVDPTGSHAAKEHLALLRRHWGWVGTLPATDADEERITGDVAIPEQILEGLTSRCI